MLISFIIPYHNEDISMLRQCIESILAVSLSENEREIILIDDGSKYSPIDQLGSIADKINYVKQENGGLSSARNHGISIAKGEYLQFIDSDDCLISRNYDSIIQMIREKKMDILMFRFTMNEQQYSVTYKSTDLGKCWKGDEYLCHNNMRAAACCYVFRSDLLGDLRFMEGILHEDAMFTPELLLKAQSIYDINLQCYFYRQHQGTIMSSRDSHHIQRRLDCHLLAIKHHNETRLSLSGKKKQGMERCVFQLIMGYIYFVVLLTLSVSEYKKRTRELRQLCLYPLPFRNYNITYNIFALLTKIF